MMDPVLNDMLPFPGWIGVWVLLAVSMALFIPRVAFFLRVFRAAKSENRFTQIGRRLVHVVVDVLFQPRFRDRTNVIHGFMWPVHFLIFWGFVVFACSFGLLLVKGLIPVVPYPWPERVGPIGLLLDVFGVIVLAALLIAAVRRYIIRPPRVKATIDAATILVLIALVMLTSLAGGAADLVASGEPANAWRPVSTAIAAWFAAAGLGTDSARVLYLAMWWSHVAIVLGFLA
ncbi:MAG: hypothetical protein QHI48_01160, partial [Bacteroidota bacterium]|nr:hypothetical protein [Bacteroidota bacterium]